MKKYCPLPASLYGVNSKFGPKRVLAPFSSPSWRQLLSWRGHDDGNGEILSRYGHVPASMI